MRIALHRVHLLLLLGDLLLLPGRCQLLGRRRVAYQRRNALHVVLGQLIPDVVGGGVLNALAVLDELDLTLSDANATLNDTDSLTIGGAFSFSAGTFNIGPGSLSVGGAFTLNGGALNVDYGTLSLGGMLTESAGSLTLAGSGTISGGTIDVTGGSFNWNGGTLSGVTFEGTLNLTASDATGVVTDGLTMAGSNGSGTGTIKRGWRQGWRLLSRD